MGRARPARQFWGQRSWVLVRLRCLLMTFEGDLDTREGLGLPRSPNPHQGAQGGEGSSHHWAGGTQSEEGRENTSTVAPLWT